MNLIVQKARLMHMSMLFVCFQHHKLHFGVQQNFCFCEKCVTCGRLTVRLKYLKFRRGEGNRLNFTCKLFRLEIVGLVFEQQTLRRILFLGEQKK